MKSKLVLVLAAAFCAGCRSDGGFDRKDNEQTFAFSTSHIAQRTREDAVKTWTTITTAPEAIAQSTKESLANLVATYHLYLETHAVR